MAEKTVCITQQQRKPIKILKWKVNEGNLVSIGSDVLLYDFDNHDKTEQRKLKSTQAGTVHKIIAQEGAIVKPGEVLFELKECSHPTIMNDMCAECGADLRKDDLVSTASVPMVHSIPDLKVSEELAQKLGRADRDRLIRDRKLVLLVDLDQTLIHTTNDNIPPNIKDVYHFQLYGPNSPWYHTRLRPGTHAFLENIWPYYELHICTFGARNYAHTIAMFLDEDQRLFSNRILSRDECFDPTSKKANLKALFPCGDNMVCIIDDREDVWNHTSNLIHVKPYHFFQHTGDINAPPGLDKHEDDNKKGVDLTKVKKNNAENENEESSEKETVNGSKDIKDASVPEVNVQPGSIQTADEPGKTVENGESSHLSDKKDEGDKHIDEEVKSTDKDEKNMKEDEKNQDEKSGDDKIELLNKTDENTANGGDCNLPRDKRKKAEEECENVVTTELKDEKSKEVCEKNPIENNRNSVDKIDEKVDDVKIDESSGNKNQSDNSVNNRIDDENSINKGNENCQDDGLIEIEDPDDYLLYLEEILKRIHDHFYDEFDRLESGEVPDLKQVIPYVRAQVLKGTKLVFSGLVPTHMRLEQSRAYQVAKSLGAEVTQDLEDDTTHLVAVRPGTAKVNAGRRRKNLKIVTPDWLWCCAERWEHVDEKMYNLSSKGSKNRHPPPHCSSPPHIPNYPEHENPAMRKRTPSGRFMDTINPLMSFSSADIASMDKEVEDILDDDSDSSEEEVKDIDKEVVDEVLSIGEPEPEEVEPESASSSSDESLSGGDQHPRGHKRRRSDLDVLADDLNNSSDSDAPSIKFRRGEDVDSELDLEQDSQDSNGSFDAPDEVDDKEWNRMGAELEREFLSND